MATAGSERKIYLGVTSGNSSTYTWISGETSNSLNLNNTAIDVSDKSSIWDSFISGSKNWDANADFNLDNSATAKQKELLQSLVAGTQVSIFIGILSSGAPADGVAGNALIESISESSERSGVITRSITFKGVGAPTPTFPAAE